MGLYQQIRNMGYTTSRQTFEIVEAFENSLDVDKLANFIRSVDGNNTMGAGQLAEKIIEFITSSL